MTKIDYTKVITTDDLKQISKEQYLQAVEIGKVEQAKMSHPYRDGQTVRQIKTGSSYLGVTLKEDYAKDIFKRKYQDLSDIERMIAYCNTLFLSETFIQSLLDKGFDYACAFKLMRLIRSTKVFLLTAKEEAFDNDIYIANKQLEKLCESMKIRYGVSDYHLILNKLCQVVWFEQELFKELTKKPYRPFEKRR